MDRLDSLEIVQGDNEIREQPQEEVVGFDFGLAVLAESLRLGIRLQKIARLMCDRSAQILKVPVA